MLQLDLEPEMSIEPGHQWIVFTDTVEGQALATLLTGGLPLIRRGNQILVPHNETVDRQIVTLIDCLAHARFSAPSLVQLKMVEDVE